MNPDGAAAPSAPRAHRVTRRSRQRPTAQLSPPRDRLDGRGAGRGRGPGPGGGRGPGPGMGPGGGPGATRAMGAGPLTDEARDAVLSALEDERKAEAAYTAVIAQFGSNPPFSRDPARRAAPRRGARAHPDRPWRADPRGEARRGGPSIRRRRGGVPRRCGVREGQHRRVRRPLEGGFAR